jgi:hypothetical protein
LLKQEDMSRKNWFFSLLLVLLVFTACRKEQRKVNRLEGKWTVRWAELPNFGKVEPDLVFKFDWCKVRFDDFCDFSAHDFHLNQTDFGIYSVSKDGNNLTMRWAVEGIQHYEVFTIERLNFRTLHLTNNNPFSSYFSEVRLRSMD